MTAGSIILVGAGPGDPELLTLKALRILQSADVVMYDALVSPEVMSLLKPQTQKIPVGKKGHGPSCKQSDINDQMVALAQQGKRVVRLKGGDPMIFSRAGEEISIAREHNIPVEIVSGITTAQAVAAQLCTSLTHRDHARRLQFVTGHDQKGELPADINWHALADAAVTTVIYMPKKTLTAFCSKLQEYGLASNTPAVAVMDATLPTQCIITGTVDTLPNAMDKANLEGPVLVVIGQVMGELIQQEPS